MKLTPLGIEGAWLAESPVWSDDRGFFREWFKAEDVKAVTGFDFSIQQANLSQSQRGVIRGIHYSLAPQGQAKWITCVSGAIRDVIVDIRPESVTFKKSVIVDLTANNGQAVLVGVGLGHGFLSLEDNTSVTYLLSTPYSPNFEYEINPKDSQLNIAWTSEVFENMEIIVSPKDAQAPTIASLLVQGKLPII